MKKLIALTLVCGLMLAFVACGGGSTETTSGEDTTKTVEPAPDTVKIDSTDTTTNP